MANTRIEVRRHGHRCPECGAGDGELGQVDTFEEMHCMVCPIDDDRHAMLRRWLAGRPAEVEAASAGARG